MIPSISCGNFSKQKAIILIYHTKYYYYLSYKNVFWFIKLKIILSDSSKKISLTLITCSVQEKTHGQRSLTEENTCQRDKD